MVEKIKKIISKVKNDKGDLLLFMLWKNAEDLNKWSVVISSTWLDKMSSQTSFNYWFALFQKELNVQDLNSISRITFLKSQDRFVRFFTATLNISGGPSYFKDSLVGSYRIKEAIVFEAKSAKEFNKKSASQRNPNINGSINPNINGSINPNINGSINPNVNYNFQGAFFYDLNIIKKAFLVEVNDSIILWFDFSNIFTGFCVKAKDGFFNVFDVRSKWIGYISTDGQDGFNYFNLRNKWMGFIR